MIQTICKRKSLQSEKILIFAQIANSICFDLPLHDNLGESWEEMIHIDKNLMRDSQLTSRPDQTNIQGLTQIFQ